MSTPTNRAAYAPYYETLDRAVDSRRGIRIECADHGAALQYRVRVHSARSLDRELNKDSRQPDDPQYGRSDYDNLIVRVRHTDNKWWVYIEPNTLPNNIEEITDATDTVRANSPRDEIRPSHLHEDPIPIREPNPEPAWFKGRRLVRR